MWHVLLAVLKVAAVGGGWATGLLCVTIAYVLLFCISFVWYSQLMPLLVDLETVSGVAQFCASVWFTFNAVFSHYQAVTVPPGVPVDALLPAIDPKSNDLKRKPGELWARFCKTCWRWKPPRSHHCHFCNCCVLKMDHHCPWINSCVGNNNQKFFCNMLVYVALAAGQITVTVGLYMVGLLSPPAPKLYLDARKAELSATVLLCGTLTVMVSLFLLWNGYLALTNQTVIEFHGNRLAASDAREVSRVWRSPFDLGWFRNLQEVYGNYPSVFQMLLPSTLLTHCDGHTYPTVFGREASVANPTGVRQPDDYDSSDTEKMPFPIAAGGGGGGGG